MKRHTTALFLGLALVWSVPAWVSAAPLSPRVLGNTGEVYSIEAGLYGDLLPGQDGAEADRPIMVLDLTRPGQDTERLLLPATLGWEVESATGLVYSRQTGLLNVVWESRTEHTVSLFLARFDDGEWSQAEEIYFSPDGVAPTVALTHDALHLELEGGVRLNAERHILHLAWLDESGGELRASYLPVLLLDGELVDARETLSLPQLNANPGQAVESYLPEFLQMTVRDEDLDSLTLTFGSSASGRITSYLIDVTPMEFVHFGDLVYEMVMGSDFDPQELASFADGMGIEIISGGVRGRGHGRSRLTSSVLGFVASEVSDRILATGASYGADDVDLLAADLRRFVIELTHSLVAPAVATPGRSKSGGHSQVLEIEVPGLAGDDPMPAPVHVLDLRLAAERPVPESEGNELAVYTSDDGLDFLAAWLDETGKVWYTESRLEDEAWSQPRILDAFGGHLSLEQIRDLLRQRIR